MRLCKKCGFCYSNNRCVQSARILGTPSASLTVTLCIADTRAPITDSTRADKSCWSVSHACNREVRLLECINMQVHCKKVWVTSICCILLCARHVNFKGCFGLYQSVVEKLPYFVRLVPPFRKPVNQHIW